MHFTVDKNGVETVVRTIILVPRNEDVGKDNSLFEAMGINP